MTLQRLRAHGVDCPLPPVPGADAVLTPDALAFLATIVRRYRGRIGQLVAERDRRRRRWAAGEPLDFLDETRAIREVPWRVAPPPPDLRRRVVEITGPVDRKMIINALNSGADVFMADFEDATAPTWENLVAGHRNLQDAVRRTIAWDDPATGREYRLAERTATLVVRPRGLHLPERNVTVDGAHAPGALVDFALHFFHNAAELCGRGSGPYFYLPKLEHHLEARLWNDVFCCAQELLAIPRGTVRATVLIETLPAAFQMDEILYELREHASGLNCGRWDYIFSFIKTLRHDPGAVMPDRAQVTMRQPCMRAYTRLAIRTCHLRGAYAMGGMAAQLPIRDDAEANDRAIARVRADKLREAEDGHDGTWVAHPALVAVAREAFATQLSGDHQLTVIPENHIRAEDLLRVPAGSRTEDGVRTNVRVGVQYVAAWLGGRGAVPIDHLMEDAATAEISRTQLWQWITHRAELEDGRIVTRELVTGLAEEELARLVAAAADEGERRRLADAFRLLLASATARELPEFLTLPAYDRLLETESAHTDAMEPVAASPPLPAYSHESTALSPRP